MSLSEGNDLSSRSGAVMTPFGPARARLREERDSSSPPSQPNLGVLEFPQGICDGIHMDANVPEMLSEKLYTKVRTGLTPGTYSWGSWGTYEKGTAGIETLALTNMNEVTWKFKILSVIFPVRCRSCAKRLNQEHTKICGTNETVQDKVGLR